MSQQAPVSISPSGESFPIPDQADYAGEFARLEKLTSEARDAGREIVVVMGVGFVGAVMAAIVADTTDADGKPNKFVIGCQRPSPRSSVLTGCELSLNANLKPTNTSRQSTPASAATTHNGK